MSKYRQRGYMESDREPQRPKPQSKPQDREGPALAKNDGIWRDVEVHCVRSKGSTEHQPRQLLPKLQR